MAETRKDALVAFDAFVESWGVKYDKAVERLTKDRDALLACYDSPPSTGSIYAPPTSSKARSRQSATARCAPRDISRTRPRWP
jgi:transposase-like protein